VTLRLRLVIALAALVTVGLAVFGVATYELYARSQYQRLDDQLIASVPLVTRQLTDAAGFQAPDESGPHGRGGPGSGEPPRGRPPVVVPPGTYAELRDRTGALVPAGRIQLSSSSAQPRLPGKLQATTASRLFDAGSVTGSGRWRVLVGPANVSGGGAVVIAIPLTEVTASLDRLVLIEAASAAALLALLATGSWLILRQGLRPLEEMATTARSISSGALSQRVGPSDGRSEIGQLGLALNTMLSDLEVAFHEREATEQRLRQFLTDASHELRTPLTSIQGFAELFRLGGDDDRVDLPVIMRRIEDESARMKVLVEDLLLLARLDETHATARAPVDLTVLAADACSDAVAAAPDRELTLDAPEPVVVLGDSDHLRQAIANLVSNAVRHTPPGAPIEVRTHKVDGTAIVAVRDHGRGLDDDALEHVFDRFWQADRSRAGTGAGLGLSIVAGIAHEHGGTATAANAQGGGARFTLHLPLDAQPD
jgi:two-component system, OmpR family, sensor kinase